jgi:aryl-alcohol dehydrogenase-like predicted oxidoreductase
MPTKSRRLGGWQTGWASSDLSWSSLSTTCCEFAVPQGRLSPLPIPLPRANRPCDSERVKVEKEFFHLYREPGLGLTIFSPLRQGILSGKYKDGIPDDSRFAQESIDFVKGFWERTGKEKWSAIVDQVNQLLPIADRLGVSMSNLALGWVLANPNVSSAIMGTSSVEQVYENIKALAVVEQLTPEIMQEIDEILNNRPPVTTMRF